jgi:hypothetical protein
VLAECSQGKISVEESRKKIYLVDSQVLSVYLCPAIVSGICQEHSILVPLQKLYCKEIVSVHLIHPEHCDRRVW